MPSRIRQTQPSPVDASFRANPLEQIRTLYVGFCQGLFAAAPPGGYHWSPSLQETEIVITDENPIQVDTIGKRPAISFTRGPVQSYSLGQDDMLTYDFETGQKKKSILVPGTMSINCSSRIDLESERLAWIVAEQLWMNREILMRAGFFEIGRQFVVGSPSPAGSIVAGDSADEWYVTTVSSPFQIYRTSQVTPLGQKILEGVSLQFQSKASAVSTPGYPANPGGADPPYSVNSSAPDVPLNVLPHPLNPAQQVVVRSANPNKPGLRPPAIRGRTIPIQQGTVEQSVTPVTVVTNVKV
jgi:hypothetical protein